MAEADPSFSEHGKELVQEPGNLKQNLVHMGQNSRQNMVKIEQILEPNLVKIEQNLEQNLVIMGQNFEQKSVKIEQGMGHNLEQNLGQQNLENMGQILEQNMGQNLEPSFAPKLEQDLGQNLENLEENLNKPQIYSEMDSELNLEKHSQPKSELDSELNLEQHYQQNSEPDTQFERRQEHEDDSTAGGGEKRWPGWPGESVFRMLVPAQKVGSIIGRKGEFIKKIVEETRARVKILDGPPGTLERAVMVSAKEEPESSFPPAMVGLLRVHKRIVDGLDGDSSQSTPAGGTKVSTRLLVPASQAGNLIGKQGTTVKTIQDESSCIVRVLGQEDLPAFALQDDRVVEVVGDAAGVHKAIELIASHLRKFLVDRSVIQLFEMHMQMGNAQMDHMPPHQSWGPPQGVPPHASGGPGFGHNPQYMPPPRQHDSYFPPADMPPPMEKQPHQGISAYGRDAPMGVHPSSNAHSAPSMITQLTQQMQIPLLFADAVIGTAGSNISYLRRASGATVTIQETRGVPGEMTVEISGTASQVQTAQQLIQNFMTEAGAPAPPPPGGSADQGYNPYAAHGSMYASPPSNPEHGGGYGSVYGSNYGY